MRSPIRLFQLLIISTIVIIPLLPGCKKDAAQKFTCPSTIDYGGIEYPAIKIGEQCWLGKNLNYEAEKSYCYNGDPLNCETYGRLYQWETALVVCPPGWHLPSNDEWTQLINFLGGDSIAGGSLKEEGTTHWKSPNTGATNASGFAILPGGWRGQEGSYRDLTYRTGIWTSTEGLSPGRPWHAVLDYNAPAIHRGYSSIYKTNALSVRCIQD